jgi:glycosyltransferase involved in cell wall biosynthesis
MRAVSRPQISVIVPVLNSRATLRRCLDSVFAQRDANVELIVVDGGSTDGSVEILREYNDRIAFWESKPDGGVYPAFNRGVRQAKGDWLYFLGSDDWLWSDDVLQKLSPHLASAYPEYRVVYGQVIYVNQKGETLTPLGEPWARFRRHFLQGHMVPHQAVFHHRRLFEEHGPFNETFRVAGDYEFLLRELAHRPALFVPGVVIAGYQHGGGSSVPENWMRVLRERRRAYALNRVRPPRLLWYSFAARTVLRAALWKVLGARAAGRLLDWGRALLGKPAIWTRIP